MRPNKKQQTKTTKHTIEFSNNKPRPPARQARGFWPRTRSADGQEPTEVGFPSGTPSRSAAGPRRDDFNKLREGKVGVKWADRRCVSNSSAGRAHFRYPLLASMLVRQHRQISQRVAPRRYSASRDAGPTTGRGGSLTAPGSS